MSDDSDDDDDFDFDGLCDALQRNDPDWTTVEVIWDRDRDRGCPDLIPDGYGPRLGQALLGNTVVETIELQVGMLPQQIANDDDGRTYDETSADAIAQFMRSSPSLKVVKLRTSGSLDGDRCVSNDETLAVQKMVMAVAENAQGQTIQLFLDNVVVEEGSYPVDVPPDTLAAALRCAKSIEKLVVWLGDGGNPGYMLTRRYLSEGYDTNQVEDKAAARNMVAAAFADNCTVKRLRIVGDSDDRSIRALVQVLRRNGSLVSVKFPQFKPSQKRLVQKYCARNKGLSNLLCKLQRQRSRVENSKSDQTETSDKDREACRLRLLGVMPTVFAVAQQSPRMAASRMLQGLQPFAEVGSGSDKKRSTTE